MENEKNQEYENCDIEAMDLDNKSVNVSKKDSNYKENMVRYDARSEEIFMAEIEARYDREQKTKAEVER